MTAANCVVWGRTAARKMRLGQNGKSIQLVQRKTAQSRAENLHGCRAHRLRGVQNNVGLELNTPGDPTAGSIYFHDRQEY